MGSYIDPLDFRTVFVNYLLGSNTIFVFALVIFLAIMSARLNIPGRLYTILLVISCLVFYAFIPEAYLAIGVLILGLVIFKAVSLIPR